MRLLALGVAIGLLIFLVTGGHVIFLPLILVPFAFLGLGRRRRGSRSL